MAGKVNKYLHLILVIILLFLSQHVFAGIHGSDTYIRTFTTIIQQQILNCPQADLTGDCNVGFEDLTVFAGYWTSGAGSPADFVGGGDGVNNNDFAVFALDWLAKGSPVIINEIHSNPDLSYELIEFVELYNISDEPVDISGWGFCDGISYTFPASTVIAAGEYIVVTEDPSPAVTPVTVMDKYVVPANKVFGPFVGNLNNEGEKIELCNAEGIEIDQVDYQLGFPWPTVGDEVPEGSYGSGHSIQLIYPEYDNDLGGSWRSAYPTPGESNLSVYTSNIPPHIRQVDHSPKQPKSNDVVNVTAKVTDFDGVSFVTLSYQIVEPGDYIGIDSGSYPTRWTDLAMSDDGLNADQLAGDSIYTVQIPSDIQIHRRLIRYRITVEDTGARSLTVPYSDDPQPNFAYFVYDGVPAWSGANNPGSTPVETFSTEVMRSLPVYHLITKDIKVIKGPIIFQGAQKVAYICTKNQCAKQTPNTTCAKYTMGFINAFTIVKSIKFFLLL